MIDAREMTASRAAFWEDKAANYVNASRAKPGKLEVAACLSERTADWTARYMKARPVLRLINGESI